jgi:DNA-binding GntR family transcriptional regulator
MINETMLADTLSATRQTSRTATVYETLLDGIINGGLPGGMIVEESALIEILKVSRTPLREALNRLHGEGFLVRQGRKLVVHHVTDRDFMEMLHLRRILECEAIFLATPKMSQKSINDIRAALNVLKMPGKQTADRNWSVDETLHTTIAKASGNSRILNLILDLRRKTKPISMRLMLEQGYPAEDLDQHVAIIEAIDRRDPDLAQRAMVAHIDSARENIIRKLGQI